MKKDEIIFFRACWFFTQRNVFPRYAVYLFKGIIPKKRCWYYLRKWTERGFYDSGVTLDLGWFDEHKLPERYKELLSDNKANVWIRPIDKNHVIDFLEYYLTHTLEDSQEHYAYERAIEIVMNAPELDLTNYTDIQRLAVQGVAK